MIAIVISIIIIHLWNYSLHNILVVSPYGYSHPALGPCQGDRHLVWARNGSRNQPSARQGQTRKPEGPFAARKLETGNKRMPEVTVSENRNRAGGEPAALTQWVA